MNQPFPRLPEFNYHKPSTSEEALSLLERYPEQSRPYAGGTDCFVQIRDRRYLPAHLVDLKSIPALNKIVWEEDIGLTIGAAASMNMLIRHSDAQKYFPVLMSSAKEVAGYQLRTRATVVGNICNASPCGDTIGPCMVYGGQIHLLSKTGERIVPLENFFVGPGKTIIDHGEIATALTLPIPGKGTCGAYKSIGRNKLGDLAIAAVTVLGYPDPECFSGFRFRIALTAVAPTVIFAEKAAELLCTEKISSKLIENASVLCAEASKPITDIRGTAEYRRDMVHLLAKRGLIETCQQLGISL